MFSFSFPFVSFARVQGLLSALQVQFWVECEGVGLMMVQHGAKIFTSQASCDMGSMIYLYGQI